MSVRRPVTAAAAAMAGLIRWVRPPRPSKLRLEGDYRRPMQLQECFGSDGHLARMTMSRGSDVTADCDHESLARESIRRRPAGH